MRKYDFGEGEKYPHTSRELMTSDRGFYKDERKKSEEKKPESSRKKKPNMKRMNEAFTKKNFTRQQRLATYHSRNFITNSAFK